ncbi:MAG: phosphodiester glycosidase family protein [Candidatus Eremiobacteraeota bacterium]|nr:phosphodiester glycosidase family protein [Candidatus Eremiobacteraeota bacterium]MCW5867314.1 phosphodiester glycosidase family protein [Candidatus Eremiobacteraeota bacterium]
MKISNLLLASLGALSLVGGTPALAAPSLLVGAPATPQVRKASAINAVHYRKLKAAGATCHVVEVDLYNPHVQLRAFRAADLGTRYRTFGSFVRQTRPIAAITGTFFDTATGTIICNLVRDGRLVEMGSVGHTLALDEVNQPKWMSTAGQYGGGHNWKDSEFAVSSGPTLLRGGQICLNPRAEGFRDPGLFRQASRAGIATTSRGKLLLVTVNQGVTLHKFAQVMQALGASDALNLDGGSSTALYARGNYVSRPGRRLTNVLLVTVRPGAPIPREVELEALQADENQLQPENSEDFGPAPMPEKIDLSTQDIWL